MTSAYALQIEDVLNVLVEATEQPPELVVETIDHANWVSRRMKRVEKTIAENNEMIDSCINDLKAEILALEERRAEVNAPLLKQQEYLSEKLIAFHQMVLQSDPKAKTIKLPYANLKSRAQQPEFIRDEDILLSWAKSAGKTYYKVKESADWSAIKKECSVIGDRVVFQGTGEIIPGIEVVDRPPKFEVEVL